MGIDVNYRGKHTCLPVFIIFTRRRELTMFKERRSIVAIVILAALLIFLIVAAVKTTPETVQKTGWALVPPLVAIILALVTKEVYSSLFVGIVTGGLLFSGFSFEGTILHVLNDGFLAALCDTYNMGILIFLVVLGAMVALMNRAGGSRAFGLWAKDHIKTRVGAQLATFALGVLIFIDDYFNCLTVGSVMRPVTDSHNVSRAKLAYIIDATAAPICIIAPVSSWAAAVSGFVEGENGLKVFIETIPYNFYALLTIVMMLAIVSMNVDFGSMAKHEANAAKGDLFTSGGEEYKKIANEDVSENGKVIDLVFPVLILVIACVIGMIYSGGFFSGESFIDSFANSDASVGLAIGSLCALIVTIGFYVCRRNITFNDCMGCVPDGFKAMVPAILILTCAWTLKNMTDSLGAKDFVAGIVEHSAGALLPVLPAVVFVIGCFLAFATGTSWGTFGILIPIVVSAFSGDHQMMILAMSACMAGAVCGDHCSPISDTTIMASAGAQCNHVNHVSTQLPYAIFVASVSLIGYLVAGFFRTPIVSLLLGIVLIVVFLRVLGKNSKKHLEA